MGPRCPGEERLSRSGSGVTNAECGGGAEREGRGSFRSPPHANQPTSRSRRATLSQFRSQHSFLRVRTWAEYFLLHIARKKRA